MHGLHLVFRARICSCEVFPLCQTWIMICLPPGECSSLGWMLWSGFYLSWMKDPDIICHCCLPGLFMLQSSPVHFFCFLTLYQIIDLSTPFVIFLLLLWVCFVFSAWGWVVSLIFYFFFQEFPHVTTETTLDHRLYKDGDGNTPWKWSLSK